MSEPDPVIVSPAPVAAPEAAAPIAAVPSQRSTPPWLPITLWLALILVALVGNSGALRGTAFLWTDRPLVSENASLNSLGGLQRTWAGALSPSTFDLPQYAPLAQSTFFIDRLIWGDRVGGYRLTSCLLHATCGLMIWWLLRRLAVPGAMVIALLFVAHPMTVESVSLLSERRTILAALFGAAGLFLALRGARAIGPVAGARFDALPPEQSRLYALAAVLLALALFAQPAIFAVAGVLLLIVWWKRQPIDATLVSLCLGMAVAGVALLLANATIERDHVRAPAASWNRASTAAGDLAVRAQVAGRAVGFYVQKLLVPFPLMTDYPRWQTPTDVALRVAFATDDEKSKFAAIPPDVAPGDPLAWFWPVAVVAIAGGGIAFAIARDRRGAAVLIGSFVLLLLPVVGFVDLGWMRNAFVADHLAYFASVPLLAGIVALLAPLLSGPAERMSLLATLAIVVAAYVLLSANVSRRYADAVTFWSAAADRRHGNYRSPLALQAFADAALAEVPPNVNDAARALENARVIRPADPALYVRIARVFAGLGQDEAARQRLRFAMVNFPDDPRAFLAAADQFVAAAATQPTDPTPRANALKYYHQAVEKDPLDAEAQVKLGEAAYEIIRRLPDPRDPQIPALIDAATSAFDQAVQLTPEDVDHLVRMARVLVPIGHLKDAGGLLKTAITLDPKRADAYALIADAAILNHDPRGAESAMRETLVLKPDDAAAHTRLGTLLATQSRFDEARPELQRAIDLGDRDAGQVLDDVNKSAATRPSATMPTSPATAP